MKTIKIMITAFIAFVVMTSCEKESFMKDEQSGTTTTGTSGTNSKKAIEMNSNPGQVSSTFSEFNVEITAIDAFIENRGWISLSHESQEVDLNELVMGTKEKLVEIEDSIFQKIDKIKITFGQNNFIVTQLNSQFGVSFFNSREFIVDVDQASNTESSILLNIDLNGSLIKNAVGYVFDPVIAHLDDPDTGVIGHVEGTNQAVISAENGDFSYQTFLTTNGDFFIQDMETGEYKIIVKAIYDEVMQIPEKEFVVIVVDGKITTAQEVTFN